MKQLFLSLLATAIGVVRAGGPAERSIQIMNKSGRRVDIHWVNPDTGAKVLQTTPDLLNGASQDLNSFVTHYFEVKELPAKKTGVCAGENEVCRVDHFIVNENQNQGELCFPILEVLLRTDVAPILACNKKSCHCNFINKSFDLGV